MTEKYIQPTVQVLPGALRVYAVPPPTVKMLPPEAFGTPTECACKSCISGCENRPGWFAPGEPEKAAELLGMTLPTFFEKYLGVDWYEEIITDDTFVLAPALVMEQTGEMYPPYPRGRCIFLDEHKRCKIHAAKPMECRVVSHINTREEGIDIHHRVGHLWREQAHRDQIADLLGRAPTVTDDDDSFGFESIFP